MPPDLSKYKEAYLTEAKNYIQLLNQSLLKFEKDTTEIKSFHEMMRALHTLKSLSATMSYNQITQICHTMEDLLEAIEKEKIEMKKCSDVLFQCFDYLDENMKTLEKNDLELDSKYFIQKIQALLDFAKLNTNEEKSKPSHSASSTLEKLKSIDVKVERLDTLMNLAEELLVNKMRFDLIREETEHPELIPAIESLGRLITELQYHVMKIRLVPIGFVFNRFVRMARDLAKKENKEVELKIESGEIEFDRLLIDEIGEVIVHLIRNAIDHGLETPKIREDLNKSPIGTIILRASRSNETAMIQVSDDGAGLDLKTIKALAIKHGLLNENASEEEVAEIIFSNLSTKKTITDISGRGLGLGIVKQKIESIGGAIKVESKPRKGTTFFIEIPLSLAIIKTLFVKISNEIYAIPLESVERLLVVTESDFKGLMKQEAIIYEGEDIPIIRLSEIFKEPSTKQERYPIVIIRKDQIHVGLVVDRLLSTQEIVIKPISRSAKHNDYFSGAAMIGSGQVILILDVASLLSVRKKEDDALIKMI